MRKTVISWLLLFACNLMWSLQFTCIKLTQDQVGPYFTVWAPMILATLLLPPFALLLLKEKMNIVRWLSFIIAIAGVILCSTGDIKQSNFSPKYAIGNILIFLAIVG